MVDFDVFLFLATLLVLDPSLLGGLPRLTGVVGGSFGEEGEGERKVVDSLLDLAVASDLRSCVIAFS
jgi:hypothetical protein